jgi:predicted enzyme related to lactoylglutathione lyase
MSYLHGKFVWFEHVSNDVSKSRTFYQDWLGWKSDGMDIGGSVYHLIQNGADGIGGFRQAPPNVPNHWIGYLSVADVDASAAAAEKAGGKILMPPTDFSPVGRGAVVADPTGAVFSIWKGSQGDRADSNFTIGDWCWMELMTTDAAKALSFYESVFGYSHQEMNMGTHDYFMLLKENLPRAGLMKHPQPNMPSFWMPYVCVAGCDASAAKAKELGANVVVPPADIPGVGRFSVIIDPLGAGLGILQSLQSK